MKFTAILTFLAFTPMAFGALVERQCGPTDCICNSIQGQFCGDENINPACLNDHVYECNRDYGTACDYGYRESCAVCGSLQC